MKTVITFTYLSTKLFEVFCVFNNLPPNSNFIENSDIHIKINMSELRLKLVK